MRSSQLFVAGECSYESSVINKSLVSVYCDDDDDDPDTRSGVILSSKLILTAIARPTKEYWCQVVIEDDIAPTQRYVRESWETLHFEEEINDNPWLMPQLQILVLYSPMVLTTGKYNDHHVAEPILYGKYPNFEPGDICTAHTIIEAPGREIDKKVQYEVTVMNDTECGNKFGDELDDDIVCIEMNDCSTHCNTLLPGSAVLCNDYLVAISEFVSGQCSSDPSNLALSFGLLNCKEGEQESQRVGIMIKETYILTASILPPIIWCEIIYNDFETRTERSESFTMTNLGVDVNLRPSSAPQLQMLELIKSISFSNKMAAKVRLISKQPTDKKFEGSEVHTYDKDSKKIVEYKVEVVDREECIKSYENLHENVICIKMTSGGCDHCEKLMAGSGVAFNDELIGVVSDDPQCDKEKPRICASVYGNLKWIRTSAGIGDKVLLTLNEMLVVGQREICHGEALTTFGTCFEIVIDYFTPNYRRRPKDNAKLDGSELHCPLTYSDLYINKM
uniref:Peptidase S1 domain-containing protein n=1 Tax=Glossina palpalis gambiensis TaxID=67801 RepID=A0A1B0AZW4_9MUSC